MAPKTLAYRRSAEFRPSSLITTSNSGRAGPSRFQWSDRRKLAAPYSEPQPDLGHLLVHKQMAERAAVAQASYARGAAVGDQAQPACRALECDPAIATLPAIGQRIGRRAAGVAAVRST